jgi:hypothetical protein
VKNAKPVAETPYRRNPRAWIKTINVIFLFYSRTHYMLLKRTNEYVVSNNVLEKIKAYLSVQSFVSEDIGGLNVRVRTEVP